MLKKLLFTLFFIFNITLSQVNMEYVREKLETDRKAGEAVFNFTIREGNSKYLDYNWLQRPNLKLNGFKYA